MVVKPILDKFEIKGIQNLSTFENRVLIEHHVPGMVGSLFQDLGAEPTLINIRGSLNYNENRQDVLNLEELRKKFQAAQPMSFVADITTATSVKEVLIKDMEIRESENWPDYYDYFIELKEHIPEPQASNIQASIDKKATSGFNNRVETTINDINKRVETAKAEKILKASGLDSSKTSIIMENTDPCSLNNFMGQLDKSGVEEMSDLFRILPNKMLDSLTKALGIEMPLVGYNSVQEVLFDLLDGSEKIIGGKPDGATSNAAGSFGTIIAKLLITVVTGDKAINWSELAGTFKKGLGNLSQ
jgi:hypothetical protein